MRYILLFCLITILSCKQESKAPKGSLTEATKAKVEIQKPEPKVRFTKAGWTEIYDIHNGFKTDIRYATDNNFVEEQMYDCGKCFLREQVAKALWKVKNEFAKHHYEIVLYDCYRPKPIQQKLWDKVPDARYVTPPHKGSMHNRGAAVDLGLTDLDGNILDMGTAYDYFGEEAYQTYTDHPKEIMDRRRLLKSTMEKYGFKSIRTEWWHYSLEDPSFTIQDWVWPCQD